jgi:hypothetical protein
MHYFSKIGVILLVLSFLLLSQVFAAPNLINYQGVLTDNVGVPLDGSVSITFNLFDVDTGGTAIWTETQSIQVQSGVYMVLLGSVTPLTSTLFDADNSWLEIIVAGETLSPRQRIVSVPYSFRSGCLPGDEVVCFTGGSTARNVGECRTGSRVCADDGFGYGNCLGEILPVDEVCDGKDNDCNTLIDEDFDFATDSANCGECSNICVGDETCISGICSLQCQPQQVACGSVCADLSTDSANCGECSNICDGDETCISGICSLQCQPQQVACGSVCADLSTDSANCGECSNICGVGSICVSGTCTTQ